MASLSSRRSKLSFGVEVMTSMNRSDEISTYQELSEHNVTSTSLLSQTSNRPRPLICRSFMS
ncbi:uncharacterized protein FTOL_11756 [Fusarium torulosum]|uniref:Uncharacterized protein n=1 Tax=Fusarium torulosum TaxID=33205 RepID=A0AAE8MJD3_9HYPO|nr:uncharacterized protein FTOL_11756 [Fusarium torulosum]